MAMMRLIGGGGATRPAIPPLIRRNTLLLALSQAFTGAGMGLVYSIGPLMIVAASGSPALSGLSVTLMGVSRFVMAYPVGRLTDVHGRKPAMLAGLVAALIGAVLVDEKNRIKDPRAVEVAGPRRRVNGAGG